MPNEDRNQYNTVIANRTRTVTTVSASATNTNGACGHEHISHSTPENNTYDGNNPSSHYTYKIEDIATAQHHLGHHIQTIISETFTIGGQPGQVIGFTTSINMSIPITSFMYITLMKIADKCHKVPVLQLSMATHWLQSW